MDWEDMRFFLAVARAGTISGAARTLGVNHSTVSRRIAAFENRLGVRLFRRLNSGFSLTAAGGDIVASAERMEDAVATVERQVLGRDKRLSGSIRVTAPDSVINKLLMPHFASFLTHYPEIELQLVAGDSSMNLTRREADVAIRVTQHPPDNLVGRHFCRIAYAIYQSTNYMEKHSDSTADNLPVLTWLEQNDVTNKPKWLHDNFPEARASSRVNSLLVLVEAAKAGMGMAQLPCYIGDAEPSLHRVSGAVAEEGWDLWLLTHPDLRTTARVRIFTEFMAQAIRRQQDLLEGRCPLV